MSIGRPKTELVLGEDERIQVSSLARSRTLPHAIVARAKVVLWSAEGVSNTEIASRLQWTNATVGKWRRRFIERRLPGEADKAACLASMGIGADRGGSACASAGRSAGISPRNTMASASLMASQTRIGLSGMLMPTG